MQKGNIWLWFGGRGQGTEKNTFPKKNDLHIRQKIQKKTKIEKSHHHGLHQNRPLETNLRVSLSTTGTSRFRLHTVKWSRFSLYRKHDKQTACVRNRLLCGTASGTGTAVLPWQYPTQVRNS
jgi:hypothetical protein